MGKNYEGVNPIRLGSPGLHSWYTQTWGGFQAFTIYGYAHPSMGFPCIFIIPDGYLFPSLIDPSAIAY